jgi:hypothetical protein
MNKLYKNISIRFVAVFGLLLFCFFSAEGQTFDESEYVELFEKLRTIKFFVSTRQDVEKLLNYSKTRESDGKSPTQDVYYDLKGAKVRVSYSTGKCESDLNNFKGYNVEKDVVVDISVLFRDYPKLSSFKMNLKKFKIFKQPGTWTFYNDKLGLRFVTASIPEYEVTSIYLEPTEKQEKMYDCGNIKK